jgi:hypothetical protein
MFLSTPLARVPGVVRCLYSDLLGPGLSLSAPSARNLLQIIAVRNRSRKRHQQGRCVAKSGPLSSPIPLTLYCICKSVIGTFEQFAQNSLMINLDLFFFKKAGRREKKTISERRARKKIDYKVMSHI